MKIRLCEIRAASGGAEAEIFLKISSDDGARTQEIKGKISAEMLFQLGLPVTLKAPISLEKIRCDEILRCMKLHAAIQKGICFLGFAKNTAKSLKQKLRMKGYPEEIAEEAVRFLIEKGYLQERDDAELLAEHLANRKHYGENRIRKEMYAKGYDAGIIRETLEFLDADFTEICQKRIVSMGGMKIFETKEDKNKAISALLRYGFSYEDIRLAQKALCEKE